MANNHCPEGWKLARLDDLGEVNRGRSRHRPRYAKHLYGGPYPFIQTGDIKASGGKITTYHQTYSEAGLAQSRLWPTGTMCITIAANIAETAVLQFPACFPDSIIGFIPDESKCDLYFVEYMFRYLRRRIQNEAIGTVQDNINLGTLDRIRFFLPPLPEQKAIAQILGALDDKIELNNRMNATIEQIGQAMFKRWFVDFEFPDEKGKPYKSSGGEMVDSELGEMPKGWEVNLATKLFRLEYGWHLPEWDRKEGNVPVFGSGGLTGFHDTFFVDGPGIIVGRAGKIGSSSIYYSHVNFCPIETTFYVSFQNKKISRYLYFLLKKIDTVNTGSSVPNLSRKDIHNAKVLIPPVELLERLDDLIQPFFELIYVNEIITKKLSDMRDSLLPKLMSGQIRVPIG